MIDIYELLDGTSITWYPLTKSEYDSLRSKATKEPISKYMRENGMEVFLLENQQVIARTNDDCGLYSNLSDLDRIIKDFEETGSKGSEILLNKNKYGKNFPEHTGALIHELADTLNIKDTIPNEELVKQVDKKIDQLQDPDTFRKQHLIHFIALVGEVLIQKHTARWEMKQSKDGITWNPFLVVRGQEVQFFVYFYEDIFLGQSKSATILMDVYETVNDIIKYNLR